MLMSNAQTDRYGSETKIGFCFTYVLNLKKKINKIQTCSHLQQLSTSLGITQTFMSLFYLLLVALELMAWFLFTANK